MWSLCCDGSTRREERTEPPQCPCDRSSNLGRKMLIFKMLNDVNGGNIYS